MIKKIIKIEVSDYVPIWIAKNIKEINSNIAFVCSNFKEVDRIFFNINELLGEHFEVIKVNDLDFNFYENIPPSAEDLMVRMQSFFKLINQSKKRKIIVFSANVLLQKITPKNILFESFFTIKNKSSDLSMKQIIDRCIMSGFNKKDIAEVAGQISVRGDILDIVISKNNAYRIDFFGNEVESIKVLDVETSRSSENLEKCDIFSSSEFCIRQDDLSNFKLNYDKLFKEKTLEYEMICERIEYAPYYKYLPLFYNFKLSNIFDYLPSDLTVISSSFLDDILTDNEREKREKIKSLEGKEVVFKYEDFYLSKDENMQKISTKNLIEIQNV